MVTITIGDSTFARVMRIRPRFPARRPLGGLMPAALVLFAAYAVFAVYHMTVKPGLPDDYEFDTGLPGGIVLDGDSLGTGDEVEFVLSGKDIGDTVRFAFGDPRGTVRKAALVPHHRAGFILFDVGIAVIIGTLGLIVALFHDNRGVAGVFLGASLALAAALLGTKTLYGVDPPWLGVALCSTFFLAYSTIPVCFLHFASIFPVRRFRGPSWVVVAMYAAAVLVAGWQAAIYLRAGMSGSVEMFRRSVEASAWMNGMMVAGIVTGLAVMIGSYRRAADLPDRKKAAWILYGLAIGTLPFVLFWALPQTFGEPPTIPEWAFKLFLLAIPVTFAIAILRYRLVDINTLISRSAVHAIVITALLALYTGLMALMAGYLSSWTIGRSILFSAVAAVLAAVGYDAIRRRAQRLVDRSLFRLSYDFRGSLRDLNERLKQSTGTAEMAERLVDGVAGLLPVDRIGFFTLDRPGNRLRAVAARNFAGLDAHGVRFDVGRLTGGLELPVAVEAHIEKSAAHEPADEGVFAKWGISLAIPLKAKDGGILGFLVLGRKSSGLMFTADDVDLLTAVAGQAAAEHERIVLHSTLVLERAESERLAELNRLKSYFVSSVSHDLKTPLTSIRMFAELLRSRPDLAPGTAEEYLRIIEGESERLTRLINNVLDFAKIERGIKEYQKRETDLNDIVVRMGAVMQYQFRIENCEPEITLADGSLTFEADPDAVLEALLNLVGNALKYGGDRKVLRVSTFAGEGVVGVSVADDGIGIPAGEVDDIFRAFHRGAGAERAARGGAGLGLSVVKHVVEAHGGAVRVESAPGRGSTFTMTFPSNHNNHGRGGA